MVPKLNGVTACWWYNYQEGKVIIFYSMLPNGDMNDHSLHGGCDVLDEVPT